MSNGTTATEPSLGELMGQLERSLENFDRLTGNYPRQTTQSDVEFKVGETTFRAEFVATRAYRGRRDELDRISVEDIYLVSADGQTEIRLPDFLASEVSDKAEEAATEAYFA
jgi:hypothetical protein